MSEEKLKGTSDMQSPETLEYSNVYKVTDIFRNDLKKTIEELPYVEAKKYFDMLDSNNNLLPAALLNEFLRSLSMLPYKYILPLMKAIEKKEAFDAYFILQKN